MIGPTAAHPSLLNEYPFGQQLRPPPRPEDHRGLHPQPHLQPDRVVRGQRRGRPRRPVLRLLRVEGSTKSMGMKGFLKEVMLEPNRTLQYRTDSTSTQN